MTSGEPQVEQKTERQQEDVGKTPESAVKEAAEGKKDLVTEVKDVLARLKAGGISGVTGEIGKPTLFDSGKDVAAKLEAPAARFFRSGELPSFKSLFGVAAEEVAGLVGPGESQAARRAEAPAGPSDSQATRPAEAPAAPGDSQARPAADTKDAPGARGDQPVVQMEPITITASADVAYRGEVINRDVEPGQHTVQRGDTLTKIAREHLGPDATAEEVQKHVREIARVNHIQNPDRIQAGQELVLPGHTADGGFVSRDNAGATMTRWQDGVERVENRDGTGYVRQPVEGGGYTEHHWGPQQQDNFEVTRTSDGRILRSDQPGEQQRESYDSEQVRTQREHLTELAESKITNAQELSQFRANMAEFEERARRQNMPPEEVAKFYQETARLLEHQGDQHTTERQRVALAEQVMDQAANPTSIDQGQHNTCNVTTVEARLYTRNPSEAARMVADVATTGQFTARDGTTVTVPPGSIAPDGEGAGNPPGYGDRSHASQIFQVTSVNLYYQTHSYQYTDAAGVVHNVPPGGMRYEQVDTTGNNPPDTGERLIDTTQPPPNNVIQQQPDLPDNGIVDVNNRLTGDTGPGVMIDHSEYVAGDAKGVTTVKSEQELNDAIAKAAREGRLPIIIGVHTGNEPLLHDSGGGAAGGSGGGHVITVTGYEAGPPARINVDNQWGEGVDYQGNKTMSVHDLYLTMRPPDNAGQIADLQRDVDWDRAHGTIDTRKEFELLRLRHNLPAGDANRLSDADFDRMMREQMTAAADRWEQQKADGTFNQAEHDNAMQKLTDMVAAQRPDRRLEWFEHMHNEGMISDERYDRALSWSIRRSRDQWAAEDAATPPTGNAAERQRARDTLERLLNALPEDRRQEVMDRSR